MEGLFVKVKIDEVVVGDYNYDSIIVKLNNKTTEIVFNKEDNVNQYKGKNVELIETEGIYEIRSLEATSTTLKKKNNE